MNEWGARALIQIIYLRTMMWFIALTMSVSGLAHGTDPGHKHLPPYTQHDGLPELPLNVTKLTKRDGLPANEANFLTEGPHGQIWFTTQNGICVFDGHKVHQVPETANLPDYAKKIFFDGKGRLWATSPDGIYVYDGVTTKRYEIPEDLRPRNIIGVNIGLFNDTTIYLRSSGMVIKEDSLMHMHKYDPAAPDIRELYFFHDNDHRWHATLDSSEQKFRIYDPEWNLCQTRDVVAFNRDIGFDVQEGPYFLEDRFSWIRFALKNMWFPLKALGPDCRPVNLIDLEDGYPVPVNDLAPDVMVYYGKDDHDAQLYVKEAGTYKVLWADASNSSRRILVNRSGDIYISSDHGVQIIHPEGSLKRRILGDNPPPPPKLLIQRIGDKYIPFHEQDNTTVTWYEKELTLELRLVTMSRQIPATQYRVNEGPWIDFSCEKPLRLTGMRHGENTVEFRAVTGVATDQEPATSVVHASITLPVMEREIIRTFASICAVILLLLIIWTIYQRLQMRKELRELKRNLYKTQLMTIQSQLNPHFLFNAMISLQNTIKNRTPEEASEQLRQLSKVIQEVLELSKRADLRGKLSDIFIPLDKEIRLLKDYVALENRQREPKFSFTLDLDPDIDVSATKVPPLMIQPFVENAIIHGIAEDDGGDIRVGIEQEGDSLTYSIEDNGVGIAASIERKKRKFQEFKSHGGTILRQRADLLNALGYPVELDIKGRSPRGTIVQIKMSKVL